MLWQAAGLAAISMATACSGSSSDGASAQSGELPVCDTGTNNLSVWGFGSTPVTMSGGIPALVLSDLVPGAGYTQLQYVAKTSDGGSVTTQISSEDAEIASGKDLTLGGGTTMRVQGAVGTGAGATPVLCKGDSGEARITKFSVRPASNGAGGLPDEANVSFAFQCDQASVKPAGVTLVRGCYNLTKATN